MMSLRSAIVLKVGSVLSYRYQLGVEHAAWGTVLGDALPTQIFEMRSKWRPLPAMSGNPRLDGDATSPVGHVACGVEARGASTTKRAPARVMIRSAFEPTGAFRGSQCLGHKWLAAAGTTFVVNPPKPDAQIIVAGHDASVSDVRLELMSCEDFGYAGCCLAVHIVGDG